MPGHAQKTVKVNAQVDSGIAPLVEALNAYPGVYTTSSCEGGDGEAAYVGFEVGVLNGGVDEHDPNGANRLAFFIETLSRDLGGIASVCDLSFTLAVEWYAGGKVPTGYLRLPHQNIIALADAVELVRTMRMEPLTRRRLPQVDTGIPDPARSVRGSLAA